jgi:sugar/nucleoside kinase (ribokinase family)
MITVVGAAAVDLVAVRGKFHTGTSNPADINMTCGGVGYRIFRALTTPRCFISTVGADPLGTWLCHRLAREGDICLHSSKSLPTARYLAFMEAGRLLVGASDMRVIEEGLTWESVRRHLTRRKPPRFLVAEGNLSPALIGGLLADYASKTRVVFECVSVAKTLRHAGVLRKLYLLAGNREELSAFAGGAGAPAAGGSHRTRLRRLMDEREISFVLETRGGKGARLYSRDAALEDFPAGQELAAADTTGAGDRLLAELLNRLYGGAAPGQVLAEAMEQVAAAIEERTL